MANVRAALDVARTARTVLGGNGITLEYPRLPAHDQPGDGADLRGHRGDARAVDRPGRRPGWRRSGRASARGRALHAVATPPCFAAYSAASAERIRPARSVDDRGKVAAPIGRGQALHGPAPVGRASATSQSLIRRRRRSAVPAASSGPASESRTTNSSPPKRPTASSPRTSAHSASATRAQDRVADEVAVAVVDRLEGVDVHHEDTERAATAIGCARARGRPGRARPPRSRAPSSGRCARRSASCWIRKPRCMPSTGRSRTRDQPGRVGRQDGERGAEGERPSPMRVSVGEPSRCHHGVPGALRRSWRRRGRG